MLKFSEELGVNIPDKNNYEKRIMSKSLFLILGVFAFTAFGPVAGEAQTSRKSVPAAEVNGTFRHSFTGKYKGSSSEIKIWALGGGKLHIGMDLIYPYTMQNGELMANVGELDGKASITGDTAVYESAETGTCKITIKFVRPGTIKVSEEESGGGCGFGHNVTADGSYVKVSSKKPKFGEN